MNGQSKTGRAASKLSATKQLLGGELLLFSEKQCLEATIGGTKTMLLSGLKIKQGNEKQNHRTPLWLQPEDFP